ncbi:unnamed protein product [Closterium sp. NIES-65]|nr:unnamed protein product [Closterium sp. NIES-65]
MGVGVGDDGHDGSMDRDALLRERARGPGEDRGTCRDAEVFRSPEERERRRDERGCWRGFGERPQGRGGDMGGDDPVGIRQENVAAEQGAEEDEEHPGLQVKEADEGKDGDDQAAGTGEAEPAQADESAGASQAAAKESRAAPREARDRDVSRGEEQRAKGLLRQEQVTPDDGVRAALAQRLHGKGKAERSCMLEKDRHHGEWRVGNFRRMVGDRSRTARAAAVCVRQNCSKRAVAERRMSRAHGSRTGAAVAGRKARGGAGVTGAPRSAARGTQWHGALTGAPPAAQQEGRHLVTVTKEAAAARHQEVGRAEDARPAHAAMGTGGRVGRAEGKAPRGGR